MAHDLAAYADALQKQLGDGKPFTVVTLIAIRGSAPQVLGAKAIVTTGGIVWGTVGGGKIEAAAVTRAQELLANLKQECQWVTWNLQTDIGMTCGGEVKLFFEVHARTQWPIAVYGAGHVSQALVRTLLCLDCHVTCIDARSEWLDKLPDHVKLSIDCVDEPETTVESMHPRTFFVLMSRGHATDLPVLAKILQSRTPPFLGVIGSKQKASVLKRDLTAMGIAEEKLDSFHCPMGLPLGNNTPEEIAISITAQLIQVRDEWKRTTASC